jgi:hypothetical protein
MKTGQSAPIPRRKRRITIAHPSLDNLLKASTVSLSEGTYPLPEA